MIDSKELLKNVSKLKKRLNKLYRKFENNYDSTWNELINLETYIERVSCEHKNIQCGERDVNGIASIFCNDCDNFIGEDVCKHELTKILNDSKVCTKCNAVLVKYIDMSEYEKAIEKPPINQDECNHVFISDYCGYTGYHTIECKYCKKTAEVINE